MIRLFSLSIFLVFAGCASGGVDLSLPQHPKPQSLNEVLANLKGDALVDLDAAMLIATAHNDPYGIACYPVLKKYLAPATGVTTVDKVVGVFSAYEKLRVERRALDSGTGVPALPPDLKIACAAMVQDDVEFYTRLAVIISGGVVPGVGAIAPLLPK